MEWLSNLISYGLAAAGVVFFTFYSHQSTVNSYQSSEFGKTFGSRLRERNSELKINSELRTPNSELRTFVYFTQTINRNRQSSRTPGLENS